MRGPVLDRALELQNELSANPDSLPFEEIVQVRCARGWGRAREGGRGVRTDSCTREGWRECAVLPSFSTKHTTTPHAVQHREPAVAGAAAAVVPPAGAVAGDGA